MPRPPLTARRRAAILACLLLAAYLLVYIPSPPSIDGAAILAVSVNLVQHGTPDIASIGSANETIGSFGPDGALYSKKGVGPSLALLPLVLLAKAVPALPLRATAMLFNPLVTLLTALLLHDLLLRKGQRAGTAFLTALLYGLGTFALAYTKSLFGEPLAALLILAALWLVETAGAGRLTPRRAALAGAALGFTLTINLTYAVLALVFAGYLAWGRPGRWRALVAYGLPLLLAGAGFGLYNMARFGGPLATGYDLGLDPGFTANLLLGAAGMLFSPYRGLFWYNPVLLLALPGWLMLLRREKRLAITGLLLVGGQLAAYGSWWSWHGGIVWGPRFLIPVLPVCMLALAPVIDLALGRPRRGVRPALVGLALLSGGIQFLGAAYSYLPYIGYLYDHYATGDLTALVTGLADTVYYAPALSPIIGHLALFRAGGLPENAWIAGGTLHAGHLLAALLLAGVGGGLAVRRLADRTALALAGLSLAAALVAVPLFQRDTPDVAAARAIGAATRGAEVTVIASDTLGKAPLDILTSRYVMSTRAPSAPEDVLAAGIWDHAQAVARRGNGQLWLANWFPPAALENWQEQQAWKQWAFVEETFAGEHRLLHFDLRPAPEADTPGGWAFGPLALAGYGLAAEPDGVRLTLAWAARESHAAPLTWFVHLLDAQGQIVAQQDRAPQGGYAPTDRWAPGDPPTVDRLFFPLPPGQDLTGWQVRIGVVDPAANAPYPVLTPTGDPLPDPFILLPLPKKH